MKTLINILSRQPLWLHYAWSDYVLFPLLYYIVRYRRGLSYRNIRSAFPEKSEAEIKDIQRRFYHHLADVIVEIIYSFTADEATMRERFVYQHVERIEEVCHQHQACIEMLGHLGNWEFTADVAQRFTDPAIRHYNVYRKQKNKRVDALMVSLREKRSGKDSGIDKNLILRHMVRLHKSGQMYSLGLIADQKPNPQSSHFWTQFLNHDTAFLDGGEVLAKKFGYGVVYIHIVRPKRGQYIGEVRPLDQEHITESFAKALEDNIREQPELWLWTHNRWKYNRNNV